MDPWPAIQERRRRERRNPEPPPPPPPPVRPIEEALPPDRPCGEFRIDPEA